MKLFKKAGFLFSVALIGFTTCTTAQEKNKFFFTTGIGLIKSPGKLSSVLHPSVAFNSGLEYTGKSNWFAQVTLDLNSLKYDQRQLDENSPYLFQRTSSSLIMGAISGGRNFYFSNNKWLVSPYAGGGYLNIGEPRLVLKEENIFRQEVSRKGGIFGKAGTRLGYKTKIKFLQIIYLDASWWESPVKVQGARLQGASFFIGTRMSM